VHAQVHFRDQGASQVVVSLLRQVDLAPIGGC